MMMPLQAGRTFNFSGLTNSPSPARPVSPAMPAQLSMGSLLNPKPQPVQQQPIFSSPYQPVQSPVAPVAPVTSSPFSFVNPQMPRPTAPNQPVNFGFRRSY